MTKGAVAAGHPLTAEAAEIILQAGGNAFDAMLAALAAACVAEPVLTSLGGGGFCLARGADGTHRVYDFFVQTPRNKLADGDCQLYPVTADFGDAQQEFHIGQGAIATPGTIHGMLEIHRELCRLPLDVILEPAIRYARDGVTINALQAYIFTVVAPIYVATPGARAIYGRRQRPDQLHLEGEVIQQAELADAIEQIAHEGHRPFYEGEWARQLVNDCRNTGGHLRIDDLKAYRTIVRKPQVTQYRGTRIYANPPPSAGGLLISFALQLLEHLPLGDAEFGSQQHLAALITAMQQTNLARDEHGIVPELHDAEKLAHYRAALAGHPLVSRGTTHISVLDAEGNAAATTLSNGEGCGYVLPGTGIMLNNMLGEEDLNPDGFNRWIPNRRVSSMMTPSVAEHADRLVVLGSGGSNRIRSAILQTLVNLIDFGMTPAEAVNAPRVHYERSQLHVEPGFAADTIDALAEISDRLHRWSGRNLFFGGAHTVAWDGHSFSGAGDARRGGVFIETG